MLADIVIDTNVLVDAGNPGVERQGASVLFSSCLLALTTKLKIDPDDLIVTEYLAYLHAGSVGLAILQKLAASDRLVSIDRILAYRIKRKITQLIANTRDRTFLCVAIESDDNLLVSHDFQDFQTPRRIHISREFGVDVVEAGEAQDRL